LRLADLPAAGLPGTAPPDDAPIASHPARSDMRTI
jgi:hypothetical protein